MAIVPFERLVTAPLPRLGLGLAAVGRPAYIDLGRVADLPADRTVEAMRDRAHAVLDTAYALGIRYFDAARSYGLAEEFLASWLDAHPEATDVLIGSKWGYTYTAGWRADAEVHEVKDHGTATYDRQIAETRALLGDRLDLYQIHSVTPDSPALTDRDLHARLARLAADGVAVGLSTSGPLQAEAIRAALKVTVDGRRLFTVVQATYNLMEPSAGPALAEAHDAGLMVIVKEAMANGRLATADPDSPSPRWPPGPGRRRTRWPSPRSCAAPGPASCSPAPPPPARSPPTPGPPPSGSTRSNWPG